MPTKKPAPAAESNSSAEEPTTPSAEERQGMRAHDEHGNVRPADGRWDLHHPRDESKHVRGSKSDA